MSFFCGTPRRGISVVILAACFALSFAAIASAQTPAPAQRPNVVIFLADDSGWGDLSASGNTNLATPHIDSLARDGASFDRFYVCPLCSPTRAEFLTGRYHAQCGVRGVSTGLERLNLDETTIAQRFHVAGYKTGCFGKWHNGSQWPYHPNARGFEEFVGFTHGHWGEYFDPPLERNGEAFRGKGYIADIFTDHALKFIDTHREQPFFCYVAFNTPHSPWAVPEKYWTRFKDKEIKLRGRDGEKEDLPTTRCALAMMENLDDNVGRVLQRLDELKLAQNTIVLYFTDNGPNTSRWNGDMKGKKGSLDEGGVRSPLFVRWPAKIKPGLVVKEEISSAVDLLPTLTSLAGVKFEQPEGKELNGEDTSYVLLGLPKRKNHDGWPDFDFVVTSHNGGIALRSRNVVCTPAREVFDLEKDPGQRNNIATDAEDLLKTHKLFTQAWKHFVKVKDDRPFPVGYVEFPRTVLPARDGAAHGGIKRSSSAPNCSYFTNWKTTDDSITWDIEVHTAGDYEAAVDYTCPKADAGSTLELNCGAKSFWQGNVLPAFESKLYTNQDTIPRPPAETPMKEFRHDELGTIHLPQGRHELRLKATDVPGKSVLDLFSLTLTLKKDGPP